MLVHALPLVQLQRLVCTHSLHSRPLADATALKLVDLLDQMGLSKEAAILEEQLKPREPLNADDVYTGAMALAVCYELTIKDQTLPNGSSRKIL